MGLPWVFGFEIAAHIKFKAFSKKKGIKTRLRVLGRAFIQKSGLYH
jgi:hypothetical protein